MAISVEHFYTSTNGWLAAISEIQLFDYGGSRFVWLASYATGHSYLYQLAGNSITQSDHAKLDNSFDLSAYTGSYSQVIDDQVHFFAISPYLSGVPYFSQHTGGQTQFVTSDIFPAQSDNGSVIGGFVENNTHYLLLPRVNGLALVEMTASGQAQQVATYQAPNGVALEAISSVSYYQRGDKNYIFAAGSGEADLVSLFFKPNGELEQRDIVKPSEDAGFNMITAQAAAEIDGRHYLVVASSGTDALIIYRLSKGGRLKEKTVTYDTHETRIAGVAHMEFHRIDDRPILFVGGADDGISIFELTYRGGLRLLTSIEDTDSTKLNNVSTFNIMVDGLDFTLVVGGQSESGFTIFTGQLTETGQKLIGGGIEDHLVGGDGNDVLDGKGKADKLEGRGGDDILIDGRGADELWGGQGADQFEFVKDKARDKIMDFEIGVDKISFAAFDHIEHIEGLDFLPRSFGCVIVAGDKYIQIHSSDNSRLTRWDFEADDFIF